METTMRREATAEQITVWRSDGFELRLYDAGTDDAGREVLRYVLHDLVWRDDAGEVGRKLFRGGDFKPSPMLAIDSDEAIGALLGFLSLGEGDTDSEYFDHYTDRQLAWRDSSRREALALCAMELEEGTDDE
jgi:hypothetical protein